MNRCELFLWILSFALLFALLAKGITYRIRMWRWMRAPGSLTEMELDGSKYRSPLWFERKEIAYHEDASETQT